MCLGIETRMPECPPNIGAVDRPATIFLYLAGTCRCLDEFISQDMAKHTDRCALDAVAIAHLHVSAQS